MDADFVNRKETENIVPIKLNNKKEYFDSLRNVEQSWSGRIDVFFANDFFREAVQLIINAIVLLEKGYFDCAFYSLRQSLELSTTVVYLVDDSEDNRKQELRRWLSQDNFPMHGQMITELKKREGTFADIRNKMTLYFNEIEEAKRSLNKYVHKQGYDRFYIYRDHPLNNNRKKEKIKMISDFETYLIKSIGAIAVFRLAVDPFPILLMDESIYNRTGDLMTVAYSDEFVEKYIGIEHTEAYKKTNLYMSYYDSIIKNEEMRPAVVKLIKFGIINREEIDEILSQEHLLSRHDLVAVALVQFSNKIANIYCIGGLHWYNTNIETKRRNMGFDSRDFNADKFKTTRYNVPYDEAFLSLMKIGEEEFYIEHNDKFDDKEISALNLIL